MSVCNFPYPNKTSRYTHHTHNDGLLGWLLEPEGKCETHLHSPEDAVALAYDPPETQKAVAPLLKFKPRAALYGPQVLVAHLYPPPL